MVETTHWYKYFTTLRQMNRDNHNLVAELLLAYRLISL